jgi:predicted nucleic acid-binding protein
LTSQVCVDASFGLKLVLAEEHSDRVRARWEEWSRSGVEILAPSLFLSEGVSAIRGQVYRGLLSPERGDFAFQALMAQGVTLLSTLEMVQRAWTITKALNRPKVYDSYYMALAEMLDCELWTADERLFNTVKQEFPRVQWIGQIEPSTG